jgi:NAD(P)-dependent dehydrogenase (short-subunit alcohol dehydrogenase family)
MADNYREPEVIFDGWAAPAGTGIIITGAASGIGAAACILAAKQGYKVSAWDIAVDGVQETIQRAGDAGKNIKPIYSDLGSDESVDAAMKASVEFGKPTYLINVAGPRMIGRKWQFDEVVALAIGLIHRTSEAFLATDPGAGAAIVNVAAIAGVFIGGGGDPWYAAAKAGIAGYSRNRAVELHGKARVNVVCPGGPIVTPRNYEAIQTPHMQNFIAHNPMGRPGRPEECAAACLFFCSPAASYVNGVVMAVDGGLHLAG